MMNKISLHEKTWIWLNKNPSNKLMMYLSIVLPYVVIGMMVIISLIALINLQWFSSITCLLFAIFLSFICFRDDSNKGYVDVIHKKYLERRKEIFTKAGLKVE